MTKFAWFGSKNFLLVIHKVILNKLLLYFFFLISNKFNHKMIINNISYTSHAFATSIYKTENI